MTTTHATPATPTHPTEAHADHTGVSPTETAAAAATLAAPLATSILAPLLDPQAAALAGILTTTWGAASAAAYTGTLTPHTLNTIPGGDILNAHSAPMLASALASTVGIATGAIGGPTATDALLAGILNPLSIPGITSLTWWGMSFIAAAKLRRILTPAKPKKTRAPHTKQATPVPNAICTTWAQHISAPNGIHPGQELHLHEATPDAWSGLIVAPAGKTANVTTDTVSSAYRVPASQVHITPGSSAGEQRITVHLVALAPLTATTLTDMWRKRVARKGGLLPGTHLEEAQKDPVTGGQVAWVVADEDRDSLSVQVDRRDLAGALRTKLLLVDYEPNRSDPRRAVIRLMDRNPLEDGTPFTGPEMLKPSKGGYFRIGTSVSGRPARVQLLDPKMGARHLIVTGVTGSGKGGVLQLLALAAHLAGASILYGDPKGSSNPVIEEMAAYSGIGEEGGLGTLLIAYELFKHRQAETARTKQKNFNPDAMPHVVVIIDEVATYLGEKSPYASIAIPIVEALTQKGRSLGITVILANQILQLAQLGSAAIRDNVVLNGGLILLRADSGQRNLIDLPPSMEGINPADIPPSWTDEGQHLVYDDHAAIGDPEATYGLGYFATLDAVPAMSRALILEDASPYVDHNNVTEPWDWPGWDRRDEIAQAAAGSDQTSPALASSSAGTLEAFMPAVKPATAEEKVLSALEECDPLELPLSVAAISTATGLADTTVQNKLGALVKSGAVRRHSKGHYVPADYVGEMGDGEDE